MLKKTGETISEKSKDTSHYVSEKGKLLWSMFFKILIKSNIIYLKQKALENQ